MREVLLYLLPCVYAFLACIGFSMLFNIHGAGMLICAGGGALGWLCYLLTGPLVGNDIIQSFFAALVISAYRTHSKLCFCLLLLCSSFCGKVLRTAFGF